MDTYNFPSPVNWIEPFEFRNSDFLECPKKEISSKFIEYQEIDLFESIDENMFKTNSLELLKGHTELQLCVLSGIEIIDPIFNLPLFEPAVIPQKLLDWASEITPATTSFIPENEVDDMLPQYVELEPFHYSDSIVEKINIKKITNSFYKTLVDTTLDSNSIIFKEKPDSNWDISNVIEYYDPKYTSLQGIHSLYSIFFAILIK